MIYFNKLLPALLSPITLAIVLITLSFMTRRKWPRILALLILLAASNPYLARMSFQYLESGSTFRSVAEIEPADKVIVLSGMIHPATDGEGNTFQQFGNGIDRFEAAIEIMKQGKAEKIIFTRGKVPWFKGAPEGEILANMAVERGVDPADILLTGTARNTVDEARAVKKLVTSTDKLFLITSAFHMPRAELIFTNHATNVTPYPVDFRVRPTHFSVIDFVPDAEAVSLSSRFVREMLGRTFYRLKYQLSDWLD